MFHCHILDHAEAGLMGTVAYADRRYAEVEEQRLQQPEALRRHRSRRALQQWLGHIGCRPRDLRRIALVSCPHPPEACSHLAAERVGLERDRAPVEAKHPGREMLEVRVRGHEHAVVDAA